MKKKKQKQTEPEVLNPSLSLLTKIGSVVVHVEEMLSLKGHDFDKAAIQSLLLDVELQTWIKEFGKLGFLPVKR